MIVATLATYPGRQDTVQRVAELIHEQVDTLHLILNEHEHIPEWISAFSKINPIIPVDDLKDTGKFFPEFDPEDIVFLLDDDIEYPSNYVQRSISEWEILGDKNIIAGYHGSVYHRPTESYLRKKSIDYRSFIENLSNHRDVLYFGFALDEKKSVDQIGTGTLIAKGSSLPDFDYMRDAKKFVDIRLARWAYENQIPMVALPRANCWLKQLETAESIFQSFTATNPEKITQEVLAFINPESNSCIPDQK